MNRALCVGVSDYQAPLGKLPGVANDVSAVADLLRGPGGQFPERTKVLVNAVATKDAIRQELHAVFAAQKEDFVFVYLAGHGGIFGGEYFYLPFGPAPGPNGENAVALAELRQLFEACSSERVLMCLDCCHSGGVIARSQETSDVDATRAFERSLTAVSGKGKLIFAACAPEQVAYESSVTGHGDFTHAVLTGLRGQAAGPKGDITANGLFDHVAHSIEEAGGRQAPMQFGQMTGRFVLRHEQHPTQPPAKPSDSPARSKALVVKSSSSWLWLDGDFYPGAEVSTSAKIIELTIASSDASTDAQLQALRDDANMRREPVGYAHANDGCDLEVTEVSSKTKSGITVWIVTAKPIDYKKSVISEVTYQVDGWPVTPRDQAASAANKILLNIEEELPARQGLRHLLFGTPVGEMACVINQFISNQNATKEKLEQVRLLAIYRLKTKGIVAQVTRLELAQNDEREIYIHFEGIREKCYDNAYPEEISVEGVVNRAAR